MIRLSLKNTHDNGWWFLIAKDDNGIWDWQPVRFDGDNVQRHMRHAYDAVIAKLKVRQAQDALDQSLKENN